MSSSTRSGLSLLSESACLMVMSTQSTEVNVRTYLSVA
jgi:hypothetical protein